VADKGLIIVPKPGELLGLLGASSMLSGTALEMVRDAMSRASLWEKKVLDKPSVLPKVDFEWLAEDALNVQARSYTQFRKEYLNTFPVEEPGVPVVAGQESESAKDNFFGVDWGSDAVAGGITKQNLKDALATLASQALKAEPLLGPQSMWDELKREEKSGVDIAFWYYSDTFLVYSIRRVADNFFYDFATKSFKMLPVSPRAGMPTAETVKPSGYVYSTRLSGQLDDGEYVVTLRDSKADDVVVGIMALFMKDGIQKGKPPQGLEDTPIEPGIPTPEGTYRRAARRVRPIDTTEPE
jgi:hypothetical protein